MEWTESLRRIIDYMEDHLLEDGAAGGAAEAAHISPFYLQRGFKLMTGYSMGEYIRCRRLYLAGLEVIAGQEKIIELAYRYGYDTPESFTKAFRRFHGVTPSQLRQRPGCLRIFLPLKIKISIQGGNDMDYAVEKMEELQFIGFEREFSMETSYRDIPKFWDEISETCFAALWAGKVPETAVERAVCRCGVGEFGVCDDTGSVNGRLRYLIAGRYDGGQVPEGLTVYTIPAMEWAKFQCSGPLPGSLQSVNTRIFQEWLPGNPDYELAYGVNIEWYSMEGRPSDQDYESAIWLPVNKRGPRPSGEQKS